MSSVQTDILPVDDAGFDLVLNPARLVARRGEPPGPGAGRPAADPAGRRARRHRGQRGYGHPGDRRSGLAVDRRGPGRCSDQDIELIVDEVREARVRTSYLDIGAVIFQLRTVAWPVPGSTRYAIANGSGAFMISSKKRLSSRSVANRVRPPGPKADPVAARSGDAIRAAGPPAAADFPRTVGFIAPGGEAEGGGRRERSWSSTPSREGPFMPDLDDLRQTLRVPPPRRPARRGVGSPPAPAGRRGQPGLRGGCDGLAARAGAPPVRWTPGPRVHSPARRCSRTRLAGPAATAIILLVVGAVRHSRSPPTLVLIGGQCEPADRSR